MAEILPEVDTSARIKVIGVGGGGGSAINRMIDAGMQGVDFAVINTDAQALVHARAKNKIHIGRETTRGLGAGADPEVGKKAAVESETEIYEAVKNADMVFITLGEGGGTGTGAAPIIAAAAREAGALVVGIITKPFTFEGERRRRSADTGIKELKENVDTLITIPNDRLLQMIDRKTSLVDAFGIVDEVLQQGVKGISDLITVHGLINLDFADVKAIMNNAGSALMGIGRARGDNRAIEAARQAIDSPLLETSIEGARGVLFNITGGRNMTMHEIDEAAKAVTDAVDTDANIIFGAVLDDAMEDDIQIVVVATGFDDQRHASTSENSERKITTVTPPKPTPVRQPESEAVPLWTQPTNVPVTESVKLTVIEQEPEVVEVTETEVIEPEPQPIFARPTVRPSGRQPFINERPQSSHAGEVVLPQSEPEHVAPPRRFAPLASIEPDDNDVSITHIETKAEPEPSVEENDDILSFDEPKINSTSVSKDRLTSRPPLSDLGVEDDDLDVPAFIRRKVE